MRPRDAVVRKMKTTTIKAVASAIPTIMPHISVRG
jgi:hypothetical protein